MTNDLNENAKRLFPLVEKQHETKGFTPIYSIPFGDMPYEAVISGLDELVEKGLIQDYEIGLMGKPERPRQFNIVLSDAHGRT
jgi:hypothetical protein